MIHELKIREVRFDRVASGEKRAEVRKHDRDFQVGDTLRLVRVGQYGGQTRHFVERNERGQFVNQYVEDAPIDVRVTHVLPAAQADGLAEGYCLLSIEVTS